MSDADSLPTIVRATGSDVSALAEVAAATFPLACPPHASRAAIAEFIGANLSAAAFADYLTDPSGEVLTARVGSKLVGYLLSFRRMPLDPDVAAIISAAAAAEANAVGTVTEVSKLYVLPGHHGAGAAQALMTAAIDSAIAAGDAMIWLGVNQENLRAQRFYAKMGFRRLGVKTFDLGGSIEHDYVLGRDLPRPAPD